MDPDTLLQQMAPLREPVPIGWWPPAPGWWILALLALTAALVLLYLGLRRWRANRYRRIALGTLKRAAAQGEVSISELNALLKAVALRAWPADTVAALHGKQWLDFLAGTDPKIDPAALAGLEDVYARPAQTAPATLQDAARHWLKHHKKASQKHGQTDD